MEQQTLLDIIAVAERLKLTTRHCYASARHPEIVAMQMNCNLTSVIQNNMDTIDDKVTFNKSNLSDYISNLREEIRIDTVKDRIGERKSASPLFFR